MREHALVESAASSNRIEGVEVGQSRIGTLIFGKSALRDRDEEEVRGYRDALKLIHKADPKLAITEGTVKQAISRQTGLFSLADLQQACPGVSVDPHPGGLRTVQRNSRVPGTGTYSQMEEES